jgi:K+-sensing histidine kinase KdpD
VLAGSAKAESTIDFARRNGVTQILVGRPRKSRLPLPLARRREPFRLLRLAREFQVTIVANRQS